MIRHPFLIGLSCVIAFLASGAGFAAEAADARMADAAMKGDSRTVRALVEQRADVNAPGPDGTPALHWLVRADDPLDDPLRQRAQ